MKVRRLIGRAVAGADRLHAIGRHRLHRLSTFDRRLMIVPYMGFGTALRLEVGGRVLRHVEHAEADAAHSGWQNFREFWKRMKSHEVPRARVRARFGALTLDAVADDEGHFELAFDLAEPLPAPGWQQVDLALLQPPPQPGRQVVAAAQVLVPAPSARFGVVSDIDDTVLWSNVRRKLRMLLLVARSNPRTRKPFEGVAALYRAFERGPTGDERNPVFYVSSSPWNLYAPLVEFLSLQQLPSGPLMLRDFGDHLLFGGGRHEDHKLRCIERILSTYPELPFVLVGDSGERDPEIYRRIVHDHPGRVRAIYIRSVDPDPARIAAIDRLVDEARAAGVPWLLAHDSAAAAEHAAALGLIDAAAPAEVRADRERDAAAPA